jgi:hypothetical protein
MVSLLRSLMARLPPKSTPSRCFCSRLDLHGRPASLHPHQFVGRPHPPGSFSSSVADKSLSASPSAKPAGSFAGLIRAVSRSWRIRRQLPNQIRTRLVYPIALRNPDTHSRLVQRSNDPPRFLVDQITPFFHETRIAGSHGFSEIVFACFPIVILSVTVDYAPWWFRIGWAAYAARAILDDAVGHFFPVTWLKFCKRFWNITFIKPPANLPMAHLPGVLAGYVSISRPLWCSSTDQHLPQRLYYQHHLLLPLRKI